MATTTTTLSEQEYRTLGGILRKAVEDGRYENCRWLLHTPDMHRLYRKVGFTRPSQRVMERLPKR